MSLGEISPRDSGGHLLVGIGKAKLVAGDSFHCRPEWSEYLGRVEVGLDKQLSRELQPGDLVALAPDGSGSVVLTRDLGPWNDGEGRDGPLVRWSANWARNPF